MKYKFLCCFILLVIGLSPMTLAYSTSYSWSVLDSSIETSAQSSANVQNDNFLNLDAESAILILVKFCIVITFMKNYILLVLQK